MTIIIKSWIIIIIIIIVCVIVIIIKWHLLLMYSIHKVFIL